MDLYIKLNAEKEEDLQALKNLTEKLTGTAITTVITADVVPPDPVTVRPEPEKEKKTTSMEKFTLEDVRKGLIELKNAKGKDAAKAVLTEFAVSKATDLPEDQFAEVVERIAKELN